jgi:hypothetical protein
MCDYAITPYPDSAGRRDRPPGGPCRSIAKIAGASRSPGTLLSLVIGAEGPGAATNGGLRTRPSAWVHVVYIQHICKGFKLSTKRDIPLAAWRQRGAGSAVDSSPVAAAVQAYWAISAIGTPHRAQKLGRVKRRRTAPLESMNDVGPKELRRGAAYTSRHRPPFVDAVTGPMGQIAAQDGRLLPVIRDDVSCDFTPQRARDICHVTVA